MDEETRLQRLPRHAFRDFVTAVPRIVLSRFMVDETPPKHAEVIGVHACVLFADVSGFTRMAEVLSARGHHGVEQLTKYLNLYFDRMIEIVLRHGGDIVRFAGDAMLLIWLDENEYRQAITDRNAEMNKTWVSYDYDSSPTKATDSLRKLTHLGAQCALDLEESLNNFTITEDIKLFLHTGVGSGKVQLVHLGGYNNHTEFLVVGEPIQQITDALNCADRGEVVLSPVSHRLLKRYCRGQRLENGFFKLHEFDFYIPKVIQSTDFPERLGSLLHCYVNPSVFARFCEGYTTTMLNEIRKVSVMFVKFPSLNFVNQASCQTAQTLFVAAQKQIEKGKGIVRQFMMDDKGCVLIACFGLPPTSHYDDPYRCVTAAQGIKQTADALRISSSIGITSGTIFCGIVGNKSRWEYALVGDLVNLAARLCGAKESDIICDENTVNGCQEKKLVMPSLGEIKVKGKADLIKIFTALDSKRVSSSPLTPQSATSFVGRNVERMCFRNMADVCKRTNENQIILYEGEPGLGKTSLMNQFQLLSKMKTWPCIFVESKYHVHVAFGAWRDFVSEALGIPQKELGQHLIMSMDDGDDVSDSQLISATKLAGFSRNSDPKLILTEPGATSSPFSSSTSIPLPLKSATLPPERIQMSYAKSELVDSRKADNEDRQKQFRMVSRRTERNESSFKSRIIASAEEVRIRNMQKLIVRAFQATQKPPCELTVLLIDDLDTMDDSSFDILCYILTHVSGLLLVATYTPSEQVLGSLSRLKKIGNVTSVLLDPLSSENITSICKQVLSVETITPSMEACIVDLCQGSPLVLKQVLRAGLEDKLITIDAESKTARMERSFVTQMNATPKDLMSSVITSSVDRLGLGDQVVLKAASCIGDIFHVKLLHYVLDSTHGNSALWKRISDRIEDCLSGLVDKGFLEVDVSSSLLVDWSKIEASMSTNEKERKDTNVYRFCNKLTRSIVKGLVPTDLHNQISAQLVQFFANEDPEKYQISLYDLAEHCMIAGDHKKALDLFVQSGDQSFQHRAIKQAVKSYEKAVELTKTVDSPLDLVIRLHRALGDSYRHYGKPEMTRKAFSTALDIARSRGLLHLSSNDEQEERPFGVIDKAKLAWKARKYFNMLNSQNITNDSLENYQIKQELLKILALTATYAFFTGTYRNRSQLEICFKIIQIASTVEACTALGQGLFFPSIIFRNLGLYSWSQRYFNASMSILEGLNDEIAVLFRSRALYIRHLMDGKLPEALDDFDFQMESHVYSPRMMISLEHSLSSVAAVLYYMGHFQEARVLGRDFEALARIKTTSYIEIAGIGMQVLCCVKLGKPQEARELLGRIDYWKYDADPSLSTTLLSCAASIYLNESSIDKTLSALKAAAERVSSKKAGNNTSCVRSIAMFNNTCLDLWQFLLLSAPQGSASSSAELGPGHRLHYLYQSLKPIVEDVRSVGIIDVCTLLHHGFVRSEQLAQTYRIAKTHHHLMQARLMMLQMQMPIYNGTPYLDRMSIHGHLKTAIREARETGMQYDLAQALLYKALSSSTLIVKARAALAEAKDIFTRLGCESDCLVADRCLARVNDEV